MKKVPMLILSLLIAAALGGCGSLSNLLAQEQPPAPANSVVQSAQKLNINSYTGAGGAQATGISQSQNYAGVRQATGEYNRIICESGEPARGVGQNCQEFSVGRFTYISGQGADETTVNAKRVGEDIEINFGRGAATIDAGTTQALSGNVMQQQVDMQGTAKMGLQQGPELQRSYNEGTQIREQGRTDRTRVRTEAVQDLGGKAIGVIDPIGGAAEAVKSYTLGNQ